MDILSEIVKALEDEYPQREPFVDDKGIWIQDGPFYKLLMSKEVFVEAFKRFIEEGK